MLNLDYTRMDNPIASIFLKEEPLLNSVVKSMLKNNECYMNDLGKSAHRPE